MIGIILSLFAALCYGLSASMQKYAIYSMKKFSFSKMIRNRKWLASMVAGAAGTVFYILALRFSSLLTVQVFLSITIIIPVLAGSIVFKEKVGVMKWFCVIMIIAGVFITML